MVQEVVIAGHFSEFVNLRRKQGLHHIRKLWSGTIVVMQDLIWDTFEKWCFEKRPTCS